MKQEGPSNIFDLSNQKNSSAKSRPSSSSSLPNPQLSDQDINTMFSKMHSMRNHLREQLHVVYDQSGLSTEEIEGFLDNPNNFSPDQWERIQTNRNKLEERVQTVLGKQNANSELKKAEKHRRGKTLGGRRNWIPVR